MSVGLKLDELDTRLLSELQKNGRMLYKELAKRLGISLPTVRARIRRLMDLGVIRKFTLVVNPDAFYGRIRALVLLKVNPTHVENVIKGLSELEEFREVFVTAGPYNLAAKVEANGVAEFGELITGKLQVEGVQEVTCLVITKSEKEEYGASIQPEILLRYKCDFCGSPIVGKPYVEIIHGGRYYFTGVECAEAFKRKLEEKGKLRPPALN